MTDDELLPEEMERWQHPINNTVVYHGQAIGMYPVNIEQMVDRNIERVLESNIGGIEKFVKEVVDRVAGKSFVSDK